MRHASLEDCSFKLSLFLEFLLYIITYIYIYIYMMCIYDVRTSKYLLQYYA